MGHEPYKKFRGSPGLIGAPLKNECTKNNELQSLGFIIVNQKLSWQ